MAGNILADREQFRLLGDQPDRLEILLRVIAQVGIERGRRGVRAHVTGDERVAIGSGARGAGRANRAAGADDILDHGLLAEMAREDVRHDPACDVGRPARRERHDDRHSLGRVVLRLRTGYAREHHKRRRNPLPPHRTLPGRF